MKKLYIFFLGLLLAACSGGQIDYETFIETREKFAISEELISFTQVERSSMVFSEPVPYFDDPFNFIFDYLLINNDLYTDPYLSCFRGGFASVTANFANYSLFLPLRANMEVGEKIEYNLGLTGGVTVYLVYWSSDVESYLYYATDGRLVYQKQAEDTISIFIINGSFEIESDYTNYPIQNIHNVYANFSIALENCTNYLW